MQTGPQSGPHIGIQLFSEKYSEVTFDGRVHIVDILYGQGIIKSQYLDQAMKLAINTHNGLMASTK
jgi:hypothetical protein